MRKSTRKNTRKAKGKVIGINRDALNTIFIDDYKAEARVGTSVNYYDCEEGIENRAKIVEIIWHQDAVVLENGYIATAATCWL